MSRIPATALARALEGFNENPDASVEVRLRHALKAADATFPETAWAGAAEAAEALDVKSPNLRRVKGLPEPYGQVRSGPFWREEDIRAIVARRQRERGVGVDPDSK